MLNEAVAVSRRESVSGYFYPRDPAVLESEVDGFLGWNGLKRTAKALIVPHGSFMHSGKIAGAVFSSVNIPSTCIIIGPTHTGSKIPWSVIPRGAYRTPLGEVKINSRLCSVLTERAEFNPDLYAHRGEHAIEVLLPFLQKLKPQGLTIVPIIGGRDDSYPDMARVISNVIRSEDEPILLIASADFSHYESSAQVTAHDNGMIEAINSLDSSRFVQYVRGEGVVTCSTGIIAATIMAARLLHSSSVEVISRGTSAERGGDPDSAIGYAGIRIL